MAIEGKDTTEYAATKSAGYMGWALMLLGAIVELGPMFVDSIPVGPWSITAGVILAAAGAALKGLTSQSFIKGRGELKKSEAAYEPAAAARGKD